MVEFLECYVGSTARKLFKSLLYPLTFFTSSFLSFSSVVTLRSPSSSRAAREVKTDEKWLEPRGHRERVGGAIGEKPSEGFSVGLGVTRRISREPNPQVNEGRELHDRGRR